MDDIQNAGDASRAMGQYYSELLKNGADNIRRDNYRAHEKHADLLKRKSFRALENVRKERGDDLRFDRDETKDIHIRIDDVAQEEKASEIMAEELKQADRYIAHLQRQNREFQEQLSACENGKSSTEKNTEASEKRGR